jgi:hypothetical protein
MCGAMSHYIAFCSNVLSGRGVAQLEVVVRVALKWRPSWPRTRGVYLPVHWVTPREDLRS